MRVQVRGDGHNLNIILPTRLVFSRCMVWLANTVGRKYAADAMENISPEALEALFAEFRRIKSQYGAWDLVDVESADGDRVLVRL